jgi:hypothetical protein
LRIGFAGAFLAVLIGGPARAQVAPSGDAHPAVPPGEWGIRPPAWLSSASIAVREGNDSNLYGVSDNLAGHPDIANISSWYTTLNAGLGFDLLAGTAPQDRPFLTALTLSYSADYTRYAAASREDNLRNTFTLDAKGKEGPWSLSINNPLLYVDGPRDDQFFNYYNNLGYGAVRERRNQIQERNTSVLRYDTPGWFVRAADSATYYNLLIHEHDPVGLDKGYANWVNRDDVNAGVDLGYKVTPDFSLVAGWRIGQQIQAQLYYNPTANDNTYNRALFGFEGKPLSWLQAQLVGGPDFRRYSGATHLGLNGDRHTWLYLQGQLTATLSPLDSIVASEKVWHFVSSAGLYSIQETAESLVYRHSFTKELSASAGVALLGHRYDAPTLRNDWTTTVPLDATYALTRNLFLSADFSAVTGHSHLPVEITPGQSFEDNNVSLSLKATF